MKNNIENAIAELEETIADAQCKIALIQSFDFTKPVTKDEWHAICETPLRYSKALLAKLVANTFPDAKNILVNCSDVYFDLKGFRVQIPTYNCCSINVDTSWYRKDRGEPTRVYSDVVQDMMNYFDAVDKKAGWYECAKHRLTYGKTCKKRASCGSSGGSSIAGKILIEKNSRKKKEKKKSSLQNGLKNTISREKK